ncbi:MAG: hypothetical protein AB7H97_12655, partial [Pseudobdellovibrionaceae bacterium]
RTATDTSGTVVQSNKVLTVTPGSASSANVYSDVSYVYTGANAITHTGAIQAKRSAVIHAGTGTVSSAYGTSSNVTNNTTGTITTAVGTIGEIVNTTTGTISNAYGLQSTVTRTAGTIGTGVGLYIGAIQATTKWSVYASDTTAPSYFAGSVGIGTGAVPATALDVNGTATVNSSYEGISSYVNSTTSYTIPDTTVNIRRITLTGNATITLPAFTTPTAKVYSLTIFLKQDGTGSRTVTFAGNASDTVKWDSGTAPTISSTANKITILQLTKPSDETVWYGSMTWKEN